MIGITNNFLSVTPNLEKLLFHLFTSIGTSSFWISFSVYNDSVFGKFTRFGFANVGGESPLLAGVYSLKSQSHGAGIN